MSWARNCVIVAKGARAVTTSPSRENVRTTNGRLAHSGTGLEAAFQFLLDREPKKAILRIRT